MKLSEYIKTTKSDPEIKRRYEAEKLKKRIGIFLASYENLVIDRTRVVEDANLELADGLEKLTEEAAAEGLLDAAGRPPWYENYEGPEGISGMVETEP